MVKLKHAIVIALFLASPAYALEGSEPAMQGSEMVAQPEHEEAAATNDADNASSNKHVHRKQLSKRPYKESIAPNQEAKKAEKGSPHKNVYHKHAAKRPHSKNVSH